MPDHHYAVITHPDRPARVERCNTPEERACLLQGAFLVTQGLPDDLFDNDGAGVVLPTCWAAEQFRWAVGRLTSRDHLPHLHTALDALDAAQGTEIP